MNDTNEEKRKPGRPKGSPNKPKGTKVQMQPQVLSGTQQGMLPIKKAVLKSTAEVKPNERKPGRPAKKETREKVDLQMLKQALLLDNVEELVREKHRKEMAAEGIKELIIPYTPSIHQQEVHELINRNRFGVVVVHRGWGKTWLAANELIRRAWSCTAPQGGKFIYIAPEKLQAKKIVWKELKFFVKDLPHNANEAELVITFPNGSTVELAGADNPDRLRGIHPHFVVLDEVAQMPQDTWYEAVYPSLRANQGGALFIGTPKGENLFKTLFEHGQDSKGWFSLRRTIFDTNVATEVEIEDLRKTMPQSKFEQEYLCSFDAAVQGTYFGNILDDPEKGIMVDVPWDPGRPVITAWDLGTTDSTVIWFVQKDPGDSRLVRVIDYYENNQKDIFHYIQYIKTKPYTYEYHIMPHDVTQVSWETGRSRVDLFKQHGVNIKIAKKVGIQEGIVMAQTLLYTCRIDRTKCKEGVTHLRQYRAKQDRKTGQFLEDPVHDMHSHAADAFRTLAVGLKNSITTDSARSAYALSSYDYFNPSAAGRPADVADDNYDLFNPGGNH